MKLMETQLLALGYDYNSNYIKLPPSILVNFNQQKHSDDTMISINKSRKRKHLDLTNLTNLPDVENNPNLIEPPYYFSVESSSGIIGYCGVLDFTAEEGIVLIPNALLNNLGIEGSDIVTIKYINYVPIGDFILLEPLDKEVFDIPKLDEYLEKLLSGYCLLYSNQIIEFNYNGKNYKILIADTKTKFNENILSVAFINIINVDLKIEIKNMFEIKKEQPIPISSIKENKEEINQTSVSVFKGEGNKLGGTIITDPKLLREFRFGKLMEIQLNNSIKKLSINNHETNIKPKTKDIIL